MKVVKYAAFTTAVILSLGIIHQATSYTSAQVTSKASMSIVSESQDALIGISVDESKIEIHNDKKDNIKFYIKLKLKNNMNKAIELKSLEIENLKTSYSLKNNQGEKIKAYDKVIGPGKTKNLKVEYTIKDESMIKKSLFKSVSGIFHFKWDGGSATIKQSLSLNSNQINQLIEKQKELEQEKIDSLESVVEEEDIIEDVAEKVEEDVIEDIEEIIEEEKAPILEDQDEQGKDTKKNIDIEETIEETEKDDQEEPQNN